MSQDQANAVRLDHIAGELERACVSTADLLVRVINHTCTRVPILAKTIKTERLWQLIEAGAQVDATLALVELELPQWRLRRLLFDNDQWFCALSRQFYFSVEFDDTADGHHADPVLAMLIAYVEALRMARAPCESTISTICSGGDLVCCDNFY